MKKLTKAQEKELEAKVKESLIDEAEYIRKNINTMLDELVAKIKQISQT